jgi:hypothetical protein
MLKAFYFGYHVRNFGKKIKIQGNFLTKEEINKIEQIEEQSKKLNKEEKNTFIFKDFKKHKCLVCTFFSMIFINNYNDLVSHIINGIWK